MIGSAARDISLQGPGLAPEHCYIENLRGTLTLYPCGNACTIDGLPVRQPTRLTQGKVWYLHTSKLVHVRLWGSLLPRFPCQLDEWLYGVWGGRTGGSLLPWSLVNWMDGCRQVQCRCLNILKITPPPPTPASRLC